MKFYLASLWVLLLSLCEVWAATNYLITQENTVLQAKSFFANHASHDAIQGTFDMSKVSKSYQKLDLSNYHKDNSELLSQYGVLDKKKMIFSDKKNIDIVQTKVGIDDQNLFASLRKGVSKVGDNIGFSDSSFTATHGQNPER